MAIELSTAGITVKWAIESTAGTRPTTGFAVIKGVKSIPEFNPEPNMLDVTDLEETEMHKYIPGLKDAGGAIGLTVNDFDDFRTSWNALLSAYSSATGGKALWIEYNIPGLTTNSSFYYKAIPSPLGFGGADVDGVYENVAYLTPNSTFEWDTASA